MEFYASYISSIECKLLEVGTLGFEYNFLLLNFMHCECTYWKSSKVASLNTIYSKALHILQQLHHNPKHSYENIGQKWKSLFSHQCWIWPKVWYFFKNWLWYFAKNIIPSPILQNLYRNFWLSFLTCCMFSVTY